MADSFVPRLQLGGSRNSSGFVGGGAEAVPRLNRTAVPLNTSNVMYGSNNNTSMTNHTLSSDWSKEGGYGDSGGAAAPPSPIPRFGEEQSRPLGRGTAAPISSTYQWQRHSHADPYGDRNDERLGSTSGSWGMPGPSTTRPLFASVSASNPRDSNVISGDTGRLPLWGSAREATVTAARYGSTAASPLPRTSAPTSGPLLFDNEDYTAAGSRSGNAFTSAYVGTSSGVMPNRRPSHVGGGVGVSDVDWRGGTRTAAPGRSRRLGGSDGDGEHGFYDESPDGLVHSRSRARADRWTDELAEEEERGPYFTRDDDMFGNDATNPGVAESARSSNGGKRRHRSRRHRHRRQDSEAGDWADEQDDAASSDSDSLSDEAGDEDPLSFADAVVRAMDAQPVVPLELLRNAQQPPFIWSRHPSHGIILSLLQHRGIYLPRYRELVDYHMAELFLHYIDLCREGAYFVYYAPSKWPKERFFRIRMLPVNRLEAKTEPVPHLVITLHESGVHILDAIALDNLVGVTVTPQAACFRPFLESPNTIIGCREGRGHRARMPVDGAFSLWFYDVQQHTSRSVDLLTCDAKVFDIWSKAFRGLVSVNSSSVVQVALTPQGESEEIAGLARAAQTQNEIDHGERKGKQLED